MSILTPLVENMKGWRPFRVSSGSFADFFPRIVLADFLLQTFAGFSHNYIAYSVKQTCQCFYKLLSETSCYMYICRHIVRVQHGHICVVISWLLIKYSCAVVFTRTMRICTSLNFLNTIDMCNVSHFFFVPLKDYVLGSIMPFLFDLHCPNFIDNTDDVKERKLWILYFSVTLRPWFWPHYVCGSWGWGWDRLSL
jgi:hypothetical protein